MRVLTAQNAVHPKTLIRAILVPMSTLFTIATLDCWVSIFIKKSTPLGFKLNVISVSLLVVTVQKLLKLLITAYAIMVTSQNATGYEDIRVKSCAQ